jgi:uncharacterized membrane protein YraQ (UPF0718 family)/YHS domain-containing protein
MFFDTFWALVFGFTLSGFIQAFIHQKSIIKSLGDASFASLARATVFGAVSSSCSYAASALGHRLIKKGSHPTAALAFMFASTNLVFEIGIVLWRLLGWQFAVAEFFGGAIMVLLLKIFVPLFKLDKELAAHREIEANGQDLDMEQMESSASPQISDAANYTLGDIRMVRKELVIGFVVAGFVGVLIPASWWNHLFMLHFGVVGKIENLIIAPFIALISFVCSVGNIPFAAALWSSGISFGGVISFIFADLITFPLLLIYSKYFGRKTTFKLLALFWIVMSLAGGIVELIFTAIHLLPHHHAGMSMGEHFGFNLNTILNIVAICVLVGIILISRQSRGKSSEFAIDPICGMQVRKAEAPARATVGGVEYFFCMQGCKDAFLAKNSMPEGAAHLDMPFEAGVMHIGKRASNKIEEDAIKVVDVKKEEESGGCSCQQ